MARATVPRAATSSRAAPAPTAEVDWARLYATVAYRRLPWYSPRPPAWLVRAVTERWLRPPGPVLDVGCGAGSSALWLSRRGFRVTGIDLAPVAVEVARRRARTAGSSAVFVQGNILATPFRDRSFGSAVDSGCFHSLPVTDRALYAREVARLVRPSGRVLVTWIAREETGEYGPPHRPSLEEVTSALEPYFVFERTEFAERRSARAWSARGRRLSRYTASLTRRRSAQPPAR